MIYKKIEKIIYKENIIILSMNKNAFELYMKNKQTNSTNKKQFTHTRIGDKSKKIFGGCYIISENEKEKFWKLYFEHVFNSSRTLTATILYRRRMCYKKCTRLEQG